MQILKVSDLEVLPVNEAVKSCLSDLLAVGDILIKTKHNRTDHFARLSVVFLTRAMQHCRNILKLDDSKDSWLIARSLIEGSAIFSWINSKPEPRAERAMKYGEIAWLSAHTLRNRIEKTVGMNQTPESKNIQEIVEASHLLSGEEAMRVNAGKGLEPITDLERLTGGNIRELFSKLDELLGSEDAHRYIYNFHYSFFSAYHHWSPLYWDITESGNVFEVHDGSPFEYNMALAGSTACLIQMCFTVDEYFGSEHQESIHQIMIRFSSATLPENDTTLRR